MQWPTFNELGIVILHLSQFIKFLKLPLYSFTNFFEKYSLLGIPGLNKKDIRKLII
jgi:hypothetical protein